MRVFVLAGAALAMGCACAALEAAPQKPFVIDDIYRQEDVGDSIRASPDGRYVALLIKRPVASEPGHHFIFTNDRSDVWLFDRKTQALRNLTQGAGDRADFWAPAWSPSGARLAMASTRKTSGGYSHVWVWDAHKDELTQLGDRYSGIDNDTFVNEHPEKLHWVSDSVLVFAAIQPGTRLSEPRTRRHLMADIAEKWAKSTAGVEPTAVTFDAGVVLDQKSLTHGEGYVACTVESQQCRDVSDAYVAQFLHDYFNATFIPSERGDVFAALSLDAVQLPDPVRPANGYSTSTYTLRVFDSTGPRVFPSLAKMKNVLPGSIHWSSDGQHVAFVGSFDAALNLSDPDICADMSRYGVFMLDVRSGALETLDTSGLKPLGPSIWGFHCRVRLNWLGNDRLMMAAEPSGWWLLKKGARPRKLTAQLDFVPDVLLETDAGRELVAVGKGNLWSLRADGSFRKLTDHPDQTKLSLSWTDREPIRGGSIRRLVYETHDRAPADAPATATPSTFYYFDVASGRESKLTTPGDDAHFQGFADSGDRQAVFRKNGRDGTSVWLSSPGAAAPTRILERNTFLKDIAEGEVKAFDYRSLDGQMLKGWVMLPVGAQPNKRYPLVTWVYQTEIQQERPFLSSIASINPLNLQPLASRGYAVLFPSMPGKVHEYRALTKGVLPAIDKLVEMGIADPQRLAVMGQSNGGYSTYGIISQTDRFKAAVAFAGMTDLTSIVLEFEGDYLAPAAPEMGYTVGRFDMLESRMQMGLPWSSQLYARNSPISYVDQIHTPLLQLHGDVDGVPLQQAQEFFTAMQRLGKRARLVQYMGDDHVFQSPANVNHSWQQVFAWLDEFMGALR